MIGNTVQVKGGDGTRTEKQIGRVVRADDRGAEVLLNHSNISKFVSWRHIEILSSASSKEMMTTSSENVGHNVSNSLPSVSPANVDCDRASNLLESINQSLHDGEDSFVFDQGILFKLFESMTLEEAIKLSGDSPSLLSYLTHSVAAFLSLGIANFPSFNVEQMLRRFQEKHHKTMTEKNWLDKWVWMELELNRTIDKDSDDRNFRGSTAPTFLSFWCGLALLARLLVAEHSKQSVSVSMENLELIVSSMNKFLLENGFIANRGVPSKSRVNEVNIDSEDEVSVVVGMNDEDNTDEEDFTPEKRLQKSVGKCREPPTPKREFAALETLGQYILPYFLEVLMSFDALLTLSQQSDQLIVGIIELCFKCLLCDPNSNAQARCFLTATTVKVSTSTSTTSRARKEEVLLVNATSSILSKLQLQASVVLRNVFLRFSNHRHMLLQDILPTLTHLLVVKQPSKTYRLQCVDQHASINIGVATLLSMLQSSSSPSVLTEAIDQSESVFIAKQEQQRSVVEWIEKKSLEQQKLHAYCWNVFLRCCYNSELQSEYHRMVKQLLQQLMVAVGSPQFPAAVIFLNMFTQQVKKIFCDVIQQTVVGSGSINTRKKVIAPVDMKRLTGHILFCMDCLTMIGSHLKENILAMEREINLKIVAVLPKPVCQALQLKLKRLESFWLKTFEVLESTNQITFVNEEDPVNEDFNGDVLPIVVVNAKNDSFKDITTQVQKKTTKGRGSKVTPKASTEAQGTTSFASIEEGKMTDIRVHFNILLLSFEMYRLAIGAMMSCHSSPDSTIAPPKKEIESICNDAAAIRNMDMDEDYPTATKLKEASQLLTSLPPLAVILRECDASPLLVERLAGVCVSDVAAFIVLQGLLQQNFDHQSFPQSKNNSMNSHGDKVLQFLMTWCRDAMFGKRTTMQQLLQLWICKFVYFAESTDKLFAFLIPTQQINGRDDRILLNFYHQTLQQQISKEFVSFQYQVVLVHFNSSHQFDEIVKASLSLFSLSSSSAIRAKVVKLVTCFVKLDPRLLNQELVCEAIIERFNDVAISVREESVKLVGTFLINGSIVVSDTYLRALMERLRDKGVSVRKAVVAILRELLLCFPEHERYADLCVALMERAALPKEEDCIRECVAITFQQIWFNPSCSPQHLPAKSNFVVSSNTNDSKFSAVDSHSILTPLGMAQAVKRCHITTTVNQLVEVVSRFPQHGWLTTILHEMFHSKHQQNDDTFKQAKKRSLALQHCESIVAQLMEKLLELEEEHARNEQPAEGTGGLNKEQNKYAATMIACITTLAIFAEANPPFLLMYLPSLVPYLKPSPALFSHTQQQIISLKIADIFTAVIRLKNLVVVGINLPEVCRDLEWLALSGGAEAVARAIGCLSLIAQNLTFDPAPLFLLGQKLFGKAKSLLLPSNQNMTSNNFLSKQQVGQLQRSLMVLGSICENYKLCLVLYGQQKVRHEHDDASVPLSWIEESEMVAKQSLEEVNITPSTLIGATFSLSYFCLQHHQRRQQQQKLTVLEEQGSLLIQARAVQTMCCAFVGCPRLMLHAHRVFLLDHIFTGQYFSHVVVTKMLLALKQMLLNEEKRLIHDHHVADWKESGVAVVTGFAKCDDFCDDNAVSLATMPTNIVESSDMTIAGFILQNHLATIVSFLSSTFSELRSASLGLIAVLAQHGMICPTDVIADVFAGQADTDVGVRQQSLQLLHVLDEKYPRCIENRFLDGVAKAHRCQLLQHQQYQHHNQHFYSWAASTEHQLSSGPPLVDVLPELGRGGVVGEEDESEPWSPSVFKSLYKACIQTNKPRKRFEFICSMLSRANSQLEAISNLTFPGTTSKMNGVVECEVNGHMLLLEALVSQTSQVLFYFATVAHMPFEFSDEPLAVVYWINRNIGSSIHCHLLLAKIHDVLLQSPWVKVRNTTERKSEKINLVDMKGNGDGDDEDGDFADNSGFIWCEVATTATPTVVTELEMDVETTMERVMVLTKLYCEAMLFEACLQLKTYLKRAYSLSDAKCVQYNPDDKQQQQQQQQSDRIKLLEEFGAFSTTKPLQFLTTLLNEMIGEGVVNGNNKKMVAALFDIHSRLTEELDQGESDFTLVAKKRKHQTTALTNHEKDSDSNATSSATVKVKRVRKCTNVTTTTTTATNTPKTRVVRRRKRVRFGQMRTIDEDDEEVSEDDDDDDYEE